MIPFAHDGNLIQNSPGLEADTWYLTYEEPGAPGLSVQLRFDGNSRCGSENMLKVCDISFEQGDRVHVEGDRSGDSVLVRTLTYVPTTTEEGTRIKLYFYDPALDQGPGGVQCTAKGLVAVDRTIPKTATPLAESIRLLLRGEISEEERERGVTSEFPLAGVTLTSAAISNGTATLTFNDPENKTGGGSCRVSILWHQIEATAKQFPTVKQVRFMPEELFQP
ncbi:MAG: GerMN domain-containing protein [Candidatus Pacebacteria bacterium]|nr:GerMN domain-containing protein [Candidatus Paceibacterota bacterium]